MGDEISIFSYMAGMASVLAITADFEENEIRCLNPRNPPSLNSIKTWDGIIDKKDPEHNDLGINKDHDLFIYRHTKWEKIGK